MFWKKKTDKKKISGLIDYDFDTRRDSFRLESEALGPAVAVYNDLLVEMLDLSAGGISFLLEGCRKGDKGTIHLELPGQIIKSVTLPVVIMRISDKKICHCRFINIDEETEEVIHKYILFRQVATQRKMRAMKTRKN